MQSHTQPEEKVELPSFRQVFGVWMAGASDKTLRLNGYTPEDVNQLGQQCFSKHGFVRGAVLFKTMLQFDPTTEEAPTFEKSGNTLEKFGYGYHAVSHWHKAFECGHRPYDMNMNLGRGLLKSGKFAPAQYIFHYQTLKTPDDPLSHQEYGISEMFRALQIKNPADFYLHKNLALDSFNKSLALKFDETVAQNKKVASILTSYPVYGKPHQNLFFQPNVPTRMIDAITQGLEQNKDVTISDSALGATLTQNPSGGSGLSPTMVTYSYTVPRFANMFALNELANIKGEQIHNDMHRVLVTSPK